MREIHMVDLAGQYRKLKAEIDEAVSSVMESAAYVKGPEIKKFEEELAAYTGAKHVISCGNGTDALQIAYMSLGLKPGDEIITSAFTFVATVETMVLLGLRPVFADVDENTFNISPEEIRKKISPDTKAIVPVHLFGQCADMEAILEIAGQYNLEVIEDAAQAVGADFIFRNGKKCKAGTMGIIGTTSFFPSKNLACCGDGGALFTSDNEIAGKIRSIANHGMKERYHYDYIGVNSRLDTLQAAILSVKLRHLDRFNEARRRVADAYDMALSGCDEIILPSRADYSTHIFHQYTIRVPAGRRDRLRDFLRENHIPTMVYYPLPIHHQKAYASHPFSKVSLPVTEKLCSEVLSLPVCPETDDEQIEYITGKVLDFFKQ
ncbi:MAG TPA: DegT/DnrJ/EryC1/StrS family aminotransferase [Bacteroidales bacterium]|nr:DegT/DnrJ/EryC1/StrS family aminotransferase [Bacteroidales bacterium]